MSSVAYRLKGLARILGGLVLVLWGLLTLPLALLLQLVNGFRMRRAATLTGQDLVQAAKRVEPPAPNGFAQFAHATSRDERFPN